VYLDDTVRDSKDCKSPTNESAVSLSVSHDQYTALPLVGVMMTSYVLINQYINLACLSVCLFVCLFVCVYPINVKTAEPIGPTFNLEDGHEAPSKASK